jgi:hypothetical protein
LLSGLPRRSAARNEACPNKTLNIPVARVIERRDEGVTEGVMSSFGYPASRPQLSGIAGSTAPVQVLTSPTS